MKRPYKRSNLFVGAIVGLAVIALAVGITIYWPKGTENTQSALHGGIIFDPQGRDNPKVSEEAHSVLISQVRPEFTMPDLSGAHRNIKEWNGKVLAVNFWATWCGPCKDEIPSFNALQKQYGPRGMQFIGIALDDAESVKAYLKSTSIGYPVLVGGEDEAMKLATRYGNDEGVVPYTAFIDHKGRIAFLQYGAISPDLAREIIESLL